MIPMQLLQRAVVVARETVVHATKLPIFGLVPTLVDDPTMVPDRNYRILFSIDQLYLSLHREAVDTFASAAGNVTWLTLTLPWLVAFDDFFSPQ